MRIILDAMGGDLGPEAVIDGAILAKKELDVELTLVGDEGRLSEYFAKNSLPRDGFTLLNASQVITMEDDPTRAIREKRDSSLSQGLTALKRGEGDAFISPGNTGALLTGATLLVGRIPGVRRAALGTLLPTEDGRGAFLIDCGANAECSSEYLVQFAEMGVAYRQALHGIADPSVGLISNGTEEHKGTSLVQETHKLLRTEAEAGNLNFVGNVECRDLLFSAAEVLVCDGFTGNAILKSIEGAAQFLMGQLKSAMLDSTSSKIAALVLKPKLRPLKKMMDYREIGGTPILGISKPVFKAHGASDALAICGAVRSAVRYCELGATEKIAERIKGLRERV